MQYKCIVKETVEDLIKTVNQLIEEGWKPQGGVSISECFLPSAYNSSYSYQDISSSDCVCYAQAMVKE